MSSLFTSKDKVSNRNIALRDGSESNHVPSSPPAHHHHPTPTSTIYSALTCTDEADIISTSEITPSLAPSVSIQTSALDTSNYDDQEEVIELIPQTVWPGVWITPQPDMSIDFSEKQLYHILQSAKQILNVETEEARWAEPSKPRRYHTNFDKQNPNKICLSIPLPTTNESAPSPSGSESTDLNTKKSPTNSMLAKSNNPCTTSHKKRSALSDKNNPRQERPKTTGRISMPSINSPSISRQKSATRSVGKSSDDMLPYKQIKYRPPDGNKVKREYWQPWNERGKISKKDTSYLEVHYDDFLPDDDDLEMNPKKFTHNHRHGFHWEIRYRIEEEKPKPELKKIERVWENEYQLFKLDSKLNKKLALGKSE